MRIEQLGQELEQSKEDQEGLAKSVCNKDEDIASWKLKAVRKITILLQNMLLSHKQSSLTHLHPCSGQVPSKDQRHEDQDEQNVCGKHEVATGPDEEGTNLKDFTSV